MAKSQRCETQWHGLCPGKDCACDCHTRPTADETIAMIRAECAESVQELVTTLYDDYWIVPGELNAEAVADIISQKFARVIFDRENELRCFSYSAGFADGEEFRSRVVERDLHIKVVKPLIDAVTTSLDQMSSIAFETSRQRSQE